MNLIKNDAHNRVNNQETQSLPTHKNIRGQDYYQQLTIDFNES